jgi:hypothetical protein
MSLPGGVCFAKALIAQIAEDEGQPASPWDHTFSYTEYKSFAGGQANFLALLVPVSQPALLPDHIYGEDNDPLFTTDPAGIFQWVYHSPSGSNADLLPPIVLYGDSFLDHYRNAGIETYLSAEYRAWPSINLISVLKNLPPGTRYFVFEFVEPLLNDIAMYNIPGR